MIKQTALGYRRGLLGPESIPKGLPGRVSLVKKKKQPVMGRCILMCKLLDVLSISELRVCVSTSVLCVYECYYIHISYI